MMVSRLVYKVQGLKISHLFTDHGRLVSSAIHIIGLATTRLCQCCVDSEGVPETLTQCTSVCPLFRKARTAAHSQVTDLSLSEQVQEDGKCL
jgi:hypothetical protein